MVFIIAMIVGVGAGLITEEVLNWIARKNAPGKVVASEQGNGMDGMDEDRLKLLLESFDAGREEVIKALEKAKKGS